jgi:glycosyltransferase involved in cell wall biosynthesis
LLFVGDGEERRRLEERVRRLGWRSVLFLGFKNQSELPRYYDLCDVFVLPSEKEPWGLVVNEAMNAAKPVVVSDRVGCAPDLVRDGVNGFVFPAGDIGALAERLRRLTEDPELARRMGEESLRIIDKWNFDADVQGLLEALDYVVGTGR